MNANVSTKSMREDGSLQKIKKAIYKLGVKHEHIECHGSGNELRLTEKHETADISAFCHGVTNRSASIRINRDTEEDGKGCFEDLLLASNVNLCAFTSKIMDTIMGPDVPTIETQALQ